MRGVDQFGQIWSLPPSLVVFWVLKEGAKLETNIKFEFSALKNILIHIKYIPIIQLEFFLPYSIFGL